MNASQADQPDSKTEQVRRWWNENPFIYDGQIGVGYKPPEEMDLAFFEKVERKLRRHGPHFQEPGAPLMSNVIDYNWVKGKKVLDIGTGTGLVAVEFARQGADLIATDITDWAARTAARNLAMRGLPGKVMRMDGQNLEFPDSTFDFVFAHGCLMHMPDTNRAIREIFRVLKPGGWHHAWFYHKGWYYWFNLVLARGIFMGYLLRPGMTLTSLTSRFTDGYDRGGNPHTKFYSRREIGDIYRRTGFIQENVRVLYNPRERHTWPFAKLPLGGYLPDSIASRLGRKIGFGVAVSARKPL